MLDVLTTRVELLRLWSEVIALDVVEDREMARDLLDRMQIMAVQERVELPQSWLKKLSLTRASPLLSSPFGPGGSLTGRPYRTTSPSDRVHESPSPSPVSDFTGPSTPPATPPRLTAKTFLPPPSTTALEYPIGLASAISSVPLPHGLHLAPSTPPSKFLRGSPLTSTPTNRSSPSTHSSQGTKYTLISSSTSTTIFCSLLKHRMMVRVGGGWADLETWLEEWCSQHKNETVHLTPMSDDNQRPGSSRSTDGGRPMPMRFGSAESVGSIETAKVTWTPDQRRRTPTLSLRPGSSPSTGSSGSPVVSGMPGSPLSPYTIGRKSKAKKVWVRSTGSEGST
ncbi:hypothetical protein G7K_5881-t1 [Saitoella complicata NRRL Y-17804]|uniref:GAR domain-containing protein n=2 Tax=Saitoella complicata (strain BCRC 22490 / CBS 7301 / JCM 7358 / NBRC 10748 / NRRL Y-17804) TaxID=698492 RepID=A0A0E9NQU6_SAICN|nr:hypothetical protein G7K_5881-t1 [Saitoella complicata NRRL Y-17804]